MNKSVYTIGRDPSCDICLYNAGNMVSRHHAVLKIKKNGSYVIVDYSLNGTFVNGVRIVPEKEVPVSRKDTISFANSADLDWSLIPESSVPKTVLKSLSIIIVFAAVLAAILYIPSWNHRYNKDDIPEVKVFYPQDKRDQSSDHDGKKENKQRSWVRKDSPKADPVIEKQDSVESVQAVKESSIAVDATVHEAYQIHENNVPVATDTIETQISDTIQQTNINAIY